MLIAIDATRAVIENAGIGRYTHDLVKKMIEIDQKNNYLLLFSYGRKDPVKEKLIQEFQRPNVKIKRFLIPGMLKEFFWVRKLPAWYNLIVGKADIFYAPSIFEINQALSGVPQVLTIYDLTTFLFPEHQGENKARGSNFRARRAISKAKKIIAISQATKNDLIKVLKVKKEKITVIYPGNHQFSRIAPKLPNNLLPKSYILAVGTIGPRKNLINLFYAYTLLSKEIQQKYPLIIVGGKGWNESEIYRTFEKLKLKDRVHFLGFQSDEILAKLYQEAAVFVYPSLYEGFGFPIIEAMQLGTPVITSKTSSMPEAGGEAALYIDPQNPKDIAKKLEAVLQGKIDRQKLSRLGKKQANKFSWEQTAQETIEVLCQSQF